MVYLRDLDFHLEVINLQNLTEIMAGIGEARRSEIRIGRKLNAKFSKELNGLTRPLSGTDS